MSNPMRGIEPLVSLARKSAEEVERAAAEGLRGTPTEFSRLQRTIHRRHVQRRWAVGAATVGVAAAAAVALVGLPRRATPITYAVAGDVQISGKILEARGSRPVEVVFSEGTTIALAPGARAEILETDSHGARWRLHEGRAHFAVVRKPESRWSVVAGPFTVRVIGTDFDVAWSSATETLEVSLVAGALHVEGPPALSLPLQAGRRLIVRGPSRALEISAINTSGASGAVEAARAVEPPAPPQPKPHAPPGRVAINQPAAVERSRARPTVLRDARPVSAPRPDAAAPAPAPAVSAPPGESPPPQQQPPRAPPISWSTRIAGGEYKIIVDEALSEGLQSSLRARSSGDLSALGDAARYVGRVDIARKALLAQRERFPETDNAASAAFHLGVLAEKRDSTSREALKWYDVYLSTAPSGTFVPETLGRRMLVLDRRDDTAAARSAAEAYRRQFPAGPYRRQADRILTRP